MYLDVLAPHALLTPLFFGVDKDADYVAYLPSEEEVSLNVYTISEMPTYALRVGSSTLAPQSGKINSKPWYRSSVSAQQIYYTPEFGWILMSTSYFPGYVPHEYQDKYDTWQGDAFYSSLVLPKSSDGEPVDFVGRGPFLNNDPVPSAAVSFWWPRWIKSTATDDPCGIYTPAPGTPVTGSKVIGLPQWTDNWGRTYTRSLDKFDGRYTYGAVHYHDDVFATWVIGTVGNAGGWWVANIEPSTSGAVTYKFTVPIGSEVTGEDITLTFSRYVLGSHAAPAYMGELGVYR